MTLFDPNEVLSTTSKMTDVVLSKESRLIKFSFLILISVISTICALYIFYNVLKFRSIRRRFQNQILIIHVILVVLYTLFLIPTTFRFAERLFIWKIESSLSFFCTVFMHAEKHWFVTAHFVLFGKLEIISSVHRLFGVKLF